VSVPGRYEHNRDLQPAALLHQVTLEGWGNESTGDVDQDGFHASLLIVEPAEQSEITDAFDQPIPAGNWVLTQDEQGFVTLNQHPTPMRPAKPSPGSRTTAAARVTTRPSHEPSPRSAAASPTRTAPASGRAHASATWAAGAKAAATQDAG
jgi:hypothetical protein